MPSITYGTVRVPKPFFSGQVTSYRFLRKDVEKIAKLVHGDVEQHMQAKRADRRKRKIQKRNKEHRALKLRHNTDKLAKAVENGSDKTKLYQKRSSNCSSSMIALTYSQELINTATLTATVNTMDMTASMMSTTECGTVTTTCSHTRE